ncbi:MAG: PqqD family protein [Ruminococcus sp.]|nr:PqqD family protein [Ruminococcus sp.]
MKLNENYIVHTDSGETLLVPTAEASFSGIVRGNKTLGLILGMLEQETTRDEIVRTLSDRFESEDGEIENDVDSVLKRLREIGAVDD